MATFPGSPVDQQYFSGDGGIVFKYDTSDNAWSKIENIAQEYKDNVDYSFVVDSNLAPDFTSSYVNEGIAEMDSYGYDKNWDTVDLYDIPAGGGSYHVITLNETIAMTTGTPDAGTLELYEVYVNDFWYVTGTLNTARLDLAGAGTQNAALSFGGDTGTSNESIVTETYDGSSWTNVATPALTARYGLAGAGSKNAAVSFGGTTTGSNYLNTSEVFNGTVWSTIDALNTGIQYLAGTGSKNAALSFGGTTGVITDITEKFDGSTWSATPLSLYQRSHLAGAGSQNAALSFGGDDTGSSSETDSTQKFDGSSWTTVASSNLTARYQLAGTGSQNAAVSFGGTTTGSNYLTTSEVFNGAAWSVSDALNTGRYGLAGAGVQNAALSFGGTTGSVSAVTEKFQLAGSKSLRGLFFNGSNSTEFPISSGDDFLLTDSGATLSITDASPLLVDETNSQLEVFYRSTEDITTDIEVAARYTPIEASSERIAVLSVYDSHYPEYRLTLYHMNDENDNDFYLELGDKDLTGYFTDISTASITPTSEYYFTLYVNPNRLAGTMDIDITVNGATTSLTDELYDVSKKFDSVKALSSGTAVITDLAYNLGTGIVGLEQLMSNLDYIVVQRSERIEIDTENTYITLPVKTGNTRFAVTNNEGITFASGYWSILSDLLTAKSYISGAGTENAAINFTGVISGTVTATTEKYNGSSWNVSGNLNTARTNAAGSGIQNAALSFSGDLDPGTSVITEKFNGSVWSVAGDTTDGKSYIAGCGSQNAALKFGGSSAIILTEKYNGIIWITDSAWNLGTGRSGMGGAGSQNAALGFGGDTGSPSVITSKFNGVSWSTTGGWNLGTAMRFMGTAGVQNAALSIGGNIGSTSDISELFDGDDWTVIASLNAVREAGAGCGSQNAALSFGGWNSGDLVITEKFYIENSISFISPNDEQTSASDEGEILVNQSGELQVIIRKEVPFGVWTVVASINEARVWLAGTGIHNAALNFGGDEGTSTESDITEKFDGTSWIEEGTTTLTERYRLSGAGSQNATISFGGTTTGADYLTTTEIFNGTIWSAAADNINTGRSGGAGAGIQNAVLSFGGSTGSVSAVTEKFDGIIWTSISGWDLNTAIDTLAGAGTQNAALSFGGTADTAATEIFDGNSWLIGSDLNTGRLALAGCGLQNAAISFGGTVAPAATTEIFNGNSWVTVVDLNTAKYTLAGTGIQNFALGIGGSDGTESVIVESFQGHRSTPYFELIY